MSDELVNLLHRVVRGGSPRGISFWKVAASAKPKLEPEAVPVEELSPLAVLAAQSDQPIAPEPKGFSGRLNHFAVGSYYHLLQEIDMAGQLPTEYWDATREGLTPEMREALRLFHCFKTKWGSVAQKWGFTEFQVELDLPRSPDAIQRGFQLFANQQVTARLDGVGCVEDPQGVKDRTGFQLPGPAYYILDFKTVGKPTPEGSTKYTLSHQAMNYMLQFQLEYPEKRLGGIIYDEISKGPEPEFRHFLATPDMIDLPKLQALVAKGAKNIEEGIFVVPEGKT